MELKIEGMTCSNCAHHVQSLASQIEGVSNATADHETGTLNINVEEGVEVINELKNKLVETKFTVQE